MTSQTPDLVAEVARLDMILERISKLEFQVDGFLNGETVEGQAFVLKDGRAQLRARLNLRDHLPRPKFYDRIGDERLRLGLNGDGTSDVVDLTHQQNPFNSIWFSL